VAPPLLPVERGGELLLSFAQARLWFLEQLEPGSSAYNIPAAVRLTGSLDVAALEQSLNEIFQRHEALRTTFAMVSGEPIQVIAPVKALTLPLVDLRQLPEAQQEAQVEHLATESAQQPFDLAMGPLLRATLLKLGEAEHVLLLTMHHIVSDGWSMGVLIRELAALYEAFSSGSPSPLPQLPIQYADFAHWQRQWLQGEVLAAQLSYWQQQLAGAQTVLELPTDRPRPAVQTFRGATQFLTLAEPLSQKLKTLSQRSGVTLFMTLLAAFQTLLYRYTGQEDICIGSPIANRNRSETEELIGFFVNTLVLRTDMSENPSFQELLGRVREVTLGAYAHQDLPFEQLVEALQPERNLSHQPLFQVMFVLQNAPMSALELPDLTLSSLEMESSTAKFDLTLSIEDTEQGLVGSLEYNTDLFDAATISRMLEHFQTLLEGIVANPDQRLSDLPLLTQLERQQLLVEWNDTQVDYPKHLCIHQLFEAQVERTPDAVAVVFEDQQLTYGELNRRANQVAHHLRSLDVGPDSLVGICVERSLEMVIGLLGILKAGGAYVPLDPDYPSERLAYMLSDSQVPVLLTQEKLMSRLSEHQARVVCLDKDWGVTLTENEENPVSGVKPENLAYVIYTSGSTGKPKGVLVTHQGLCNLGSAQIRLFDLRSDSRVLQFASFSFDASISEIVMALCSGAMLCLGTRESLLPGHTLMQFLLEHAITHMTLPPSALATLPTEELPALQNIIVAGEACSTALFAQWSKGRRFFNAYGPTESTVCATVYECPNGSRKLPIGRPIINTQVYILDPHLQPVPVGVPGELYIGGAGLARGYLNRPELTSEKFICNPFSDEPGARLYKTGDLGRYLSDGNIEFLGRLDDQVKIRGFRIELGEIETVLGQHPAVNEAVVVVREDVPGNKRLVAYVVLNASSAPSMQELLHHFLKQQLPEYMVPSALVLLEALPLTPNGKIDRRTLPAPDMARPEWSGALVSPRTPVEKQLAGIWADVLGLQQVGIHDNFFEVGGDSILSIQIIARANQAGLKLTPKHLFQHQTIAELAEVAGTGEANQAEQGLVTGEVLLTPIQRWFFEQDLPQPHHWNQAMLLEVRQPVDVVVLQQVVQQLLEHHDVLRLRFVRQPNGWQQINALPDETLTVARVDLTALPKAEQSGAIEAAATELQASLNLESGWLVRVALFDLGPNQHQRLLLAIHHLLYHFPKSML
jgi:amino acid adenylation domain-containing protein